MRSLISSYSQQNWRIEGLMKVLRVNNRQGVQTQPAVTVWREEGRPHPIVVYNPLTVWHSSHSAMLNLFTTTTCQSAGSKSPQLHQRANENAHHLSSHVMPLIRGSLLIQRVSHILGIWITWEWYETKAQQQQKSNSGESQDESFPVLRAAGSIVITRMWRNVSWERPGRVCVCVVFSYG